MKLWSLGTGSSGNAILMESAGEYLLVDAGFPVRVLESRLAAIGVPGEAIADVVVTHEHHDHARGAAAGMRRFGWTLHATRGTIALADDLRDARPLEAGASMELGAFTVETVPTPHDAAEPVGVIVTARSTGARAAVAYDIGRVTATLRRSLEHVDILVIEANHDEDMLAAGPYPPSVRARIAGPRGHLSNRGAASLARDCVHRGMSHVVLAHLSQHCNDAEMAMRVVSTELARARYGGGLHAVRQGFAAGPFTPGRRQRLPTQLDLGI